MKRVSCGAGWFTVAKPPGLPVFPPHTDPDGDCVQARLEAAFPEQRRADWPGGFEGGLAHRLDIPTSGQLVVGCDPDGLVRVRQLFTSRQLRKRYLFCTRRDVAWDAHTVDRAISHDRRRKGRMVVQRGGNTPHRGRWLPARTELRRIGAMGGGLFAWEAVMRTGVMHQIRLHAAFAGIALAGDRHYGGGERPPWLPDGVPFALHHLGLVGPELQPDVVPPPACWPLHRQGRW